MLTWHLCQICPFDYLYPSAVQLLRFGANVHHAAASGATTPLHEAVIRNAVSTTELLLKAGANPFLENGQVSSLQLARLLATRRHRAASATAAILLLANGLVGTQSMTEGSVRKQAASEGVRPTSKARQVLQQFCRCQMGNENQQHASEAGVDFRWEPEGVEHRCQAQLCLAMFSNRQRASCRCFAALHS